MRYSARASALAVAAAAAAEGEAAGAPEGGAAALGAASALSSASTRAMRLGSAVVDEAGRGKQGVRVRSCELLRLLPLALSLLRAFCSLGRSRPRRALRHV